MVPSRKQKRKDKLLERCHILAETISSIRPIYLSSSTTDSQRQLLETMIGAALWYMPQFQEHWTGYISISALKSFLPSSGESRPKCSLDHCFPRKLAAAYLLSNHEWAQETIPGLKLKKLYDEKFGLYNYISPAENRKLMPFQRKDLFQGMEKAYRAAGIELVKVSHEQLKQVKARNESIILTVLAFTSTDMNQSYNETTSTGSKNSSGAVTVPS